MRADEKQTDVLLQLGRDKPTVHDEGNNNRPDIENHTTADDDGATSL